MQLRALSQDESGRLVQILRRRSGPVAMRLRAQLVLLCAQGLDVTEVSRLVGVSEREVRDGIRSFNRAGFEWLRPTALGGRPTGFASAQRTAIKDIALSLPAEHALPFSRWSLRKLADFLRDQGIVEDISHEGLRLLLHREGIDLRTAALPQGELVAGLAPDVVEQGQHLVQFYEHDVSLALAVADYLGAGLVAGHAALVVATQDHRERFEAALWEAGVDVAESSRFVTLDVDEVLARLLIGGMPDSARFHDAIGSVIEDLTASGAPLRVYGEIVAVLWERGAVNAAMALEELWTALGRARSFALLCAYPQASFEASPSDPQTITECHSGVVATPAPYPMGPSRAARRFEPTRLSVSMARRFVTETLEGWGLHRLVDAAELVVAELVGNAVRHGGCRFLVTVDRLQDTARVAVTDPSEVEPRIRAEDPESTGGRGLHLIAAVSNRWGTDLFEGGKTVWAEVGRSPARMRLGSSRAH